MRLNTYTMILWSELCVVSVSSRRRNTMVHKVEGTVIWKFARENIIKYLIRNKDPTERVASESFQFSSLISKLRRKGTKRLRSFINYSNQWVLAEHTEKQITCMFQTVFLSLYVFFICVKCDLTEQDLKLN